MEYFNLKILPFVLSAVIFSFLAFNISASLITEVEIMLDFNKVGLFLLFVTLYISLTALSIAMVLSQVKNIYFRLIFFFLIFLPYTSIFILGYPISLTIMLGLLVVYAAMIFSILMEFDHLYANQIKTYIEIPARANARTFTFFIALVVSVIFLAVSNNPTSQKSLGTRIQNQITNSISTTIVQYDLINKMSGDIPGGALETKTSNKELEKLITDQVNTMLDPYMDYIIYILAILIFGTIAGASTLVGIATTIIGFVLIYILKSVGYIKEVKQTVEVTRITL